MSISHKSSNTQLFRLMIYRRALHPELFNLQGRRLHRQGAYEAEAWISAAGHVLRFSAGGQVMTEAVVERGDHLPEIGLVHSLPCLGEEEYTSDLDQEVIGYVTTLQAESLTDNLFMATYREMRDFAVETDALSYEWTDDDGSLGLSILDVQKYKREFHIQSYHLIGTNSLVLRTQSIFEML